MNFFKIYALLSFFVFSINLCAKEDLNYLAKNLTKHDWDGIEVNYLKDDSLPVYTVTVYFSDGALYDIENNNLYGGVQAFFNLLDSGTNRYSHEDIADHLDYFGVNTSSNIFHEYSTFSYSGLTKDLVPTTKMICHLFEDSTYPEYLVKNYVKRSISGLESMITSHGALANRVFRKVLFAGTKLENPADGTIQSLKNIESSTLKKISTYFNKKVKKRIYLQGPKSLLELKNIFLKECNWNKTAEFKRKSDYENKEEDKTVVNQKKNIYFAPIESANQAQILIGANRWVKDLKDDEVYLEKFSSGILGGGFSSLLIQELRVKRGLTYSAGSYVSWQRDYARTGMTTFTKNESLIETLNVIDQTVKNVRTSVDENTLNYFKSFMKGNFLFSIESKSSLFESLIYHNHIERSVDEIYLYPKKISELKRNDVIRKLSDLYSLDNQIILILGDKGLLNKLKSKYKDVKILNYKNFL